MQDALMTYFSGEKNAGLLLMGVALLGVMAAAVFYQDRWGFRSLAVTLAVLALIEMAIGVGLYLRTDSQVKTLLAQLGSQSARFYNDEAARMRRVQRNFVVIEYVELAVIVLSAIVAVSQKHRPTLIGIALGLLINGAFLLAFDLTAERRGAVYLASLESR